MSTPARAEPEAEDERCFSAYEETQIKLKEGKYTEAIALSVSCSEGCPSEINEQCKGWARQAERDAPTVLLFARFEDGKDAPGISVEVDGEAGNLRQEVTLDPGPHRFVFRGPDGFEETVEVEIYPGEKRRPIKVTVPDPKEKLVTPPDEEPEAKPKRGARNWAIVSFAVGGVGIGVATTATIIALGQKADLDACAPTCPPSEVDEAKQTLLVADVGFVVGAVGVATGVALLLWGNPNETKKSQATLSFEPFGAGAQTVVRGRF